MPSRLLLVILPIPKASPLNRFELGDVNDAGPSRLVLVPSTMLLVFWPCINERSAPSSMPSTAERFFLSNIASSKLRGERVLAKALSEFFTFDTFFVALVVKAAPGNEYDIKREVPFLFFFFFFLPLDS